MRRYLTIAVVLIGGSAFGQNWVGTNLVSPIYKSVELTAGHDFDNGFSFVGELGNTFKTDVFYRNSDYNHFTGFWLEAGGMYRIKINQKDRFTVGLGVGLSRHKQVGRIVIPTAHDPYIRDYEVKGFAAGFSLPVNLILRSTKRIQIYYGVELNTKTMRNDPYVSTRYIQPGYLFSNPLYRSTGLEEDEPGRKNFSVLSNFKLVFRIPSKE